MIRLGLAAPGALGVILTIRALIIGSASASGESITRSEESLATIKVSNLARVVGNETTL